MHVPYAHCMTTIQIRNVPEEVSRELKSRAAAEGRSLSDFLLTEVTRIAARPSRADIMQRILQRPRIDLRDVAEMVDQERRIRP